MAQPEQSKEPPEKIDVERGPDKRLADMLERALSTRSSRHGNVPKREKPAKAK
jgi:hypothetical protein